MSIQLDGGCGALVKWCVVRDIKLLIKYEHYGLYIGCQVSISPLTSIDRFV